MTERSAMGTERQAVCPFVAFDDDRDYRSSVPDHRHYCFADSPAASRALAHQAAYCLSSAFAGCPTFIDWARREAAPPKEEPARTLREAPTAPRQADRSGESARRATTPQPTPATTHRQRRAEWTAPPPWVPDSRAGARAGEPAGEAGHAPGGTVPSAGAAAPAGDETDASPGLGAWSGSALGGLAAAGIPSGKGAALPVQQFAEAHRELESAPPEPDAPAFLAGRASRPVQATAAPATPADLDLSRGRPLVEPSRRGAVGYAPGDVSRRPMPGPGRDRDRAIERAPGRAVGRGPDRPVVDPAAPSWERPRRFEAYPSLKSSRGGVASLPRPVQYGLIVLIVGIALFATPFLLRGLTSGGGPSASPTPAASSSPGASSAPSVTPVPSPSPTVYTVKAGDVLSRIAVKYGVTVDQIVKANPQIKDPDKLALGDQLVIPPAVAPAITDGTITPAP